MTLTKAEKVLVSKLQSGKLSQITEVLKEFNVNGSVPLIHYLFELVSTRKFQIIDNDILRIISDIKEKDAVPVIVESLRKYDFKDKIADIIATCWQSSLDFSAYLDFFAEYFFKNDYQTSIEVFTVIEESLHNTTIPQRKSCLNIIEKNSGKVSEILKPLYNELHKLLKNSLELSIDNSKSIS